MKYSIEPRDRILVKDYIFFTFAENIGQNIGSTRLDANRLVQV